MKWFIVTMDGDHSEEMAVPYRTKAEAMQEAKSRATGKTERIGAGLYAVHSADSAATATRVRTCYVGTKVALLRNGFEVEGPERVVDLGYGINEDGTGRTPLSGLMDKMFGRRTK